MNSCVGESKIKKIYVILLVGSDQKHKNSTVLKIQNFRIFTMSRYYTKRCILYILRSGFFPSFQHMEEERRASYFHSTIYSICTENPFLTLEI